ncbi:unnamed protein product [Urochloa humidicola]
MWGEVERELRRRKGSGPGEGRQTRVVSQPSDPRRHGHAEVALRNRHHAHHCSRYAPTTSTRPDGRIEPSAMPHHADNSSIAERRRGRALGDPPTATGGPGHRF